MIHVVIDRESSDVLKSFGQSFRVRIDVYMPTACYGSSGTSNDQFEKSSIDTLSPECEIINFVPSVLGLRLISMAKLSTIRTSVFLYTRALYSNVDIIIETHDFQDEWLWMAVRLNLDGYTINTATETFDNCKRGGWEAPEFRLVKMAPREGWWVANLQIL